MLFIFEEEELVLCFRRLLCPSVFPSFGFTINLLLPAVPSEEDLRRFSMNLPSRYGLKLLERSTTNRKTISKNFTLTEQFQLNGGYSFSTELLAIFS